MYETMERGTSPVCLIGNFTMERKGKVQLNSYVISLEMDDDASLIQNSEDPLGFIFKFRFIKGER